VVQASRLHAAGTAAPQTRRSGLPVTPRLLHGGRPYARFLPGSSELLTLAYGDPLLRIWDLGASKQPLPDLVRFAEFIGCQRIDDTGGVLRLSTDECEQRQQASQRLAAPNSTRAASRSITAP